MRVNVLTSALGHCGAPAAHLGMLNKLSCTTTRKQSHGLCIVITIVPRAQYFAYPSYEPDAADLATTCTSTWRLLVRQ